jgi:ATP-binding cassette, subfamily C (CFTR/MRP), member 1
MTDQWLAFWTVGRFNISLNLYIIIYVCLGFLQMLFAMCFGFTNAYFGATASKRVHARALAGVFKSPIAFFDSTPMGRITSRFSRDIDTLGILDLYRQPLARVLANFSVYVILLVLELCPY